MLMVMLVAGVVGLAHPAVGDDVGAGIDGVMAEVAAIHAMADRLNPEGPVIGEDDVGHEAFGHQGRRDHRAGNLGDRAPHGADGPGLMDLEAAIRDRVGKDCHVESSVDDQLIGGAVIRIGDAVIDLSMRGRLAALEQQLG